MQLRTARTFTVQPNLPPELEPLRALAANLFWTWNTDTASLFERLSPERWRATGHNPVRMLYLTPYEELARLAHDEGFLGHLHRASDALARYLSRPPQVLIPGTDSDRAVIAYFSFEFALTESLPSYSGGLGVLAGDHLKSASDLGLPLVGVGLLYRQGYFQQSLTADGWQSEEYHDLDPVEQPLQPVRRDDGSQLLVDVPFDSREVKVAIWRLDVGQVPLFLLDSDVPGNTPEDRRIASRLYGGDIETRIQQEILLGIGGVRALRALGFEPAVCHMNEGHSALLGLERIRELMEAHHVSFEEARLPVAASTAFTTHTAVAAGIDLFPPDLVRRYLRHYYTALGLDDRAFIGLGRIDPNDDHEPFSMALLGLRLSGFRNGVSVVHQGVSRRLWESAWPNLPHDQIPIAAVTNGVHLPTWVAHDIGELYDRYVGTQWRDDPVRSTNWDRVHDIPDRDLWSTLEQQRTRLVLRARQRARETAARHGLVVGHRGAEPLDPGILTIGFARRFASYKRATLLFRDLDRLAAILNHSSRPVQVIFAGKAHPRDEPAKQLIREVVAHSRRPEFRQRLVVLEGYDVDLARSLVQGCDVWLNTPLRPLEASGTSGMKAVANGSLHMSVLDGWWAEAYRPGLGWAIGRDNPADDPEVQDAHDAESIYTLLENEVAPAFYDRDHDGVPRDWLNRVKGSIAAYTPVFSTHRMVGDYASNAYAPAAARWARLRQAQLRPAHDLAAWLERVRADWPGIHVLEVTDDAHDGLPTGSPVTVCVRANWGALAPADVRVEVVHGTALPDGTLATAGVVRLDCDERNAGPVCTYTGTFAAQAHGRAGYAVRVTPNHPDLHDPLDTGLVLWA
jgi:starch phosphorylase